MSLVGGDTYDGIDEQRAVATIRRALELGINFFDTAPAYGNGRSEELLGAAIKGRREGVVIATKVGRTQLTAEGVARSCEESLRRLGVATIDLLQVHWPSREVPIDETIGALERLKREGKVRAIGVCNFGIGNLRDIEGVPGISSNQTAYSLLMRGVEFEVLPWCVARGVGLLAYSPLAQGLLTGRYASADDVPESRARTRHFSGKRPKSRHGGVGHEIETFAAIGRIRAIADALGLPMADVAVAWLIAQTGVTAALVGASSPGQVERNVRAAGIRIETGVIAALNDATRDLKDALGPDLDLWAATSRSW